MLHEIHNHYLGIRVVDCGQRVNKNIKMLDLMFFSDQYRFLYVSFAYLDFKKQTYVQSLAFLFLCSLS